MARVLGFPADRITVLDEGRVREAVVTLTQSATGPPVKKWFIAPGSAASATDVAMTTMSCQTEAVCRDGGVKRSTRWA
jgi:hypothetical protein